MNRTKAMIEVMQAYLDGKQVQWKDRGIVNEWKDCKEEPSWHLDNDYRIKPEPKQVVIKQSELEEIISIAKTLVAKLENNKKE